MIMYVLQDSCLAHASAAKIDPKGTIPVESQEATPALSRAKYFTRSRFIHLSHLIILCASIFLVVCVLLSERECVDDDNPVSTSSSTITHTFTITFRFLSFLHFPFLPSNPCPPLFATNLPLYCTFLTRFASPKLPTNLLPFREDFSSDCQYRHALGSLNEHTTDSYSLAGFCSRYGEPIESHGDSVDSLPGNEQESSPAPFDSTIVTSTISFKLLICLGGILV
jgi:hypothetical protein